VDEIIAGAIAGAVLAFAAIVTLSLVRGLGLVTYTLPPDSGATVVALGACIGASAVLVALLVGVLRSAARGD